MPASRHVPAMRPRSAPSTRELWPPFSPQLSSLRHLLSLMRPSTLGQYLGPETMPPGQEKQPKASAQLDHKVSTQPLPASAKAPPQGSRGGWAVHKAQPGGLKAARPESPGPRGRAQPATPAHLPRACAPHGGAVGTGVQACEFCCGLCGLAWLCQPC